MLPLANINWADWHVPLAEDTYTLQEVISSATSVAATQDEVPLIIKLIENPNFSIPGVTLFNGAVDLHDHDCIHAILGRGLLPKDEAFTIGFTMGSTNRVTSSEIRLYAFAAKFLYPGPYKFDDDDIAVFKDAVHLGFVSDCLPLNKIDFKNFYHLSLGEVRQAISLEVDLLLAYYRIEKKRYRQSRESQRLI